MFCVFGWLFVRYYGRLKLLRCVGFCDLSFVVWLLIWVVGGLVLSFVVCLLVCGFGFGFLLFVGYLC